jgi:protein YibB
LHNDIVVFTSPDLVEILEEVCQDSVSKVTIVPMDIFQIFDEMRSRIKDVQQRPDYISQIKPSEAKNPEYWNQDYVLVTNLKAVFPNIAIDNNLVENDMVAWIDFGYCRSDNNITKSQSWNYSFDPDKIHLFSYKGYDGEPIQKIVAENKVYILGAKVVAHKKMWPEMARLMEQSHYKLLDLHMVDDDQGLWLLSYILKPEVFELHQIPDHQLGYDPFVLFNQFNDTI